MHVKSAPSPRFRYLWHARFGSFIQNQKMEMTFIFTLFSHVEWLEIFLTFHSVSPGCISLNFWFMFSFHFDKLDYISIERSNLVMSCKKLQQLLLPFWNRISTTLGTKCYRPWFYDCFCNSSLNTLNSLLEFEESWKWHGDCKARWYSSCHHSKYTGNQMI